MGFIFDGLDAEAYDRHYTDRALVVRVIGYFKPQLGRMLVVAVSVVLITSPFDLTIDANSDFVLFQEAVGGLSRLGDGGGAALTAPRFASVRAALRTSSRTV